MSEVLTFNTTTGLYTQQQTSKDPWHHLPADKWVEKQVDWANQSEPSGLGLVEPISKLQGDLIGVEIGVCLGATTEAFLKLIPNIKKLYGVDNYPTFIDWNGGDFNKERQQLMKEHAVKRLEPFSDKLELCYESSVNFVNRFTEEECLDFVFIDGDHSEESSFRDFTNFYPLIKSGGVFAGHDIGLAAVSNSLKRFFSKEQLMKIILVSNNSWYMIKE
jgi:predicted O-methyltransferase YrrM